MLADLDLPVESPPHPTEARRARFVAAVTAVTVLWLGGMCVLGAAVAGNYFAYPYAERDPGTERALDGATVWLGAFTVGGPLVIALLSAAGRLPIVALTYAVVALLCGLLVLSVASADLAPDRPVPNPTPHHRVSPGPSRGMRTG
ncbi:DUF6234 family protein [Actinorhabdospora filicis]|uniref:DUF6234 family protein n=1 Tax=Actinorhabdospora filicis TaxID=1785913 RepID=UPI002553A80F|nr:DUF6234 family protein [Actinorhabdospora filicis]